MITRKLGKLILGEATSFQLFSACLLASLIGFMPGFFQAPGLLVCLGLLLILLNANLGLAALVGGVAKLVSLLVMPLSFWTGHALLDGPLQGFFRSIVNAPVLALFGFDYYATTGGLALGLLFGIASGWLITGAIGAFRRKVIHLQENSEAYKKWTGKTWVRLLTSVLVGGQGKKSLKEKWAPRVGPPFRMAGVFFVVTVLALIFILQGFFKGPIVAMMIQQGLQRANGATVDLQSASLDLKDNRLTLAGLALADPNDLNRDLFRARKLEADLSGLNLLRKRLQFDRIVATGASYGDKRAVPGHLIGPPPKPLPAAAPAPGSGVKTIDDYIRNAKIWKQRLAQVRRWLKQISGPSTQPATPKQKAETLKERLEREIQEKGYTHVRDDQLIQGSPRLTVSALQVNPIHVPQLTNETLNLTGFNLSTEPRLLPKTPRLFVESSRKDISFKAVLGQFGRPQTQNVLEFQYLGLPTDKVAQDLKLGGKAPIQGGTIDLNAKGTWQRAAGISVDLPVQVTLHQVTVSLPKMKPTKVDNLSFPIALTGPIDNPRIKVDEKQLAQALAKAGLSTVASELKGKAKQAIGKELNKQLGNKAGGFFQKLFKGTNSQNPK